MITGCRFYGSGSVRLSKFQNSWSGQDVYLLGSGRTLQYFDPEFFVGKRTIGINYGWSAHVKRVDFLVTKYHHIAREYAESEIAGNIVVTRGLRGHITLEHIKDDRIIVVDHNDNTVNDWTPRDWPHQEHALVATHSSIATGLHLGAYLGAANIFIAGGDCGSLDGEQNVSGYDGVKYNQLLKSFDHQTRQVRDEIHRRYGTRVMTLLPFTSPNMDGHRYESHAGTLNAT